MLQTTSKMIGPRQDTQTAIEVAEKKDANLSSRKYQPKTQTGTEFIVTSQRIALRNLTTVR